MRSTQLLTSHTLLLALALASAYTGPGFTLPGSGQAKDLALALWHKEAMGATLSLHLHLS